MSRGMSESVWGYNSNFKKVKTFSCSNLIVLEQTLENWFRDNSKYKILDIKYSSHFDTSSVYTVLIIYE